MGFTKCHIIFGLLVCIAIHQTLSQNPADNALDMNLKRLAVGSEKFSLDIFQRVANAVESVDYNFMISPFSLWALLLMCAEGATGQTLSELQNVLGTGNNFGSIRQGFDTIQKALMVNSPTVEVDALQAIFSNSMRPIKPDYKHVLKSFYRTDIMEVDFRQTYTARNYINNYIKQSTRGLIDYVVNESDLQNADLALISTIYFKGQWKFPFNSSLTNPEEPFYDERGQQTSVVKMMYMKAPFPYTAIGKIDSHVVELPYGEENRLVMIIFLPKKGASLTSVIEKIRSYGLENINAELRKSEIDYEDDEIELYLPRFSTETDFQMNIILEQMGILDAFNPEKAKFTKMTNTEIFLTNIFHKTKIEVTEEGTVASAASGGIFANKSTPPRVYLNRPFAYIIWEKSSRSVLFCGQIRKPGYF